MPSRLAHQDVATFHSMRAPAWPATSRLQLLPAPDGLALVQDLLNTCAGPWGPDLFDDIRATRTWSRRAARTWSKQRGMQVEKPDLDDNDARELIGLRDSLTAVVRAEVWPGPVRRVGTAVLAVSGDGTVGWNPDGTGWRWWSAAIWNEVLLSRQAGTFERLKLCSHRNCRAAFYDRTWDRREVRHSSCCGAPDVDPG